MGGSGGGGATSGPPPGTVDPLSLGVLQANTSQAIQQMQNRYSQLGLGGGSTANPSGGMGVPELMDIGQASGIPGTPSEPSGLPSLVGGIQGMAGATLGQMETNALQQPQPASAVSNSGKGGAGSALGPAIGLIGKGV